MTNAHKSTLSEIKIRLQLMGQKAMEGNVESSSDLGWYFRKLTGNYNRLMMHNMNQEMADQAADRILNRLFNAIALTALAS